MKLLVIDTVTEMCSVALASGDDVIHSEQRVEQSHTDVILEMVNNILASGEMSLSQLDAIAFNRGPGSFTGLRVCAGVAQGLALSQDLPVIAVSSLAALAQGAWREQQANNVLSVIDARMKEVYWGCFESSDGIMVPVCKEKVTPPDRVRPPAATQWLGVGTGFTVYRHELCDNAGVNLIAVQEERFPLARDCVPLAIHHWKNGQYGDAGTALPVYLRDNVATPKS